MGLGTDIDTHSYVDLSLNVYAKYQWENYGAANQNSWDGYRFKVKYMVPITTLWGGVARVNVGALKAGTGRNVVADTALMKVETRGVSNQVNDDIYQQALRIIAGAAAMYGVEYEVKLMGAARSCTPTQPWVDFLHHQADALGIFRSVVDRKAQAAGSEDATYMMERVKQRGGQATYAIFGCDLAAGHHNAKFDFDEGVMGKAVQMLATLALNQAQFGGAR